MRKGISNGSRFIKTHTGHRLTPKEEKYIQLYTSGNNPADAYIGAGYKYKDKVDASIRAHSMMRRKPYMQEEIQFRANEARSAACADMTEILEYFTRVMRGEEKDQFDFDAPLTERTRAAIELAKRLDFTHNNAKPNEGITIHLDWGE